MAAPLRRPVDNDALFLWVMHRFAEVFEEHAILKGGMALRLFDCPRSTNDLDYVFVPYRSKNDITDRIEEVLGEVEGAVIDVRLLSKMLRATVAVDEARIQIEATVAQECASQPVPTAGFAEAQGEPSRIVRVMSLSHALAHKLAAWNERRLLRDLYDVYFLTVRLQERPAMDVLETRLAKVQSRRPELKGRKKMTRAELADELEAAVGDLDEVGLRNELRPLIMETEFAGLLPRLKGGVMRVVELLRDSG